MPKRVPPSPEQVAEALRRRAKDAGTRAIPLDEAATHVRREFRTTKGFAEDWLTAAAVDEGNFLVITRAHGHGRISGALTRNAGRHHCPEVDNPFLLEAFTLRGFLAAPLDDVHAPIVRYDGEFIPRERRLHPIKNTGVPPALEGTVFAVLPEALVSLVTRMREEILAEQAVRTAERHVEDAAVTIEQGVALSYLRGLLKAAGVGLTAEVTATMLRRPVDSPDVAATVHLVGSDIDRVAAVLQRLGIEPVDGEFRSE